MERAEYARLNDLEATYWWFRGLRSFVKDALSAAGFSRGGRFLDAGCGTGQTLLEFERDLGAKPFGFDLSSHAVPFWPARGLSRMCRASVNALPYADASFDAVVSIDVLESEGVDEIRAFRELWRVTRPGGFIVIVVPAYDWMKTESHHRAVHASRRYSRRSLERILQSRPVRILRLTHLFASVFPSIAAIRLLLRSLSGRPASPRSELVALPRPLNAALSGLMGLERRVLRRFDLSIGSSLLALARREGA